jgi:hypothetical protein
MVLLPLQLTQTRHDPNDEKSMPDGGLTDQLETKRTSASEIHMSTRFSNTRFRRQRGLPGWETARVAKATKDC